MFSSFWSFSIMASSLDHSSVCSSSVCPLTFLGFLKCHLFFLKISPVDVFMTYDRGAVLDTTLQVSICLCHSSLLNLLLLVLPGVLSVGHSSTFVFPSCGAVLFLLF